MKILKKSHIRHTKLIYAAGIQSYLAVTIVDASYGSIPS